MSAFADRSEVTTELTASLIKALAQMEDVTKTKDGHNYKYAPLDRITSMARTTMAEHGLTVTQTATTEDNKVAVYTTIFHTSGQFLTYAPLCLPLGNKSQETGSAITYARRYALMAVLSIAGEDDDGATAGTWEQAKTSQHRKPIRNDPPMDFHTADKVGSERRTFLLTEVGRLRNVNKTASDYTAKALNDAKAKVVSDLSDDALESLYKALYDISFLG